MKSKSAAACHTMPEDTSRYLGHFRKPGNINKGHNTVEEGKPQIQVATKEPKEEPKQTDFLHRVGQSMMDLLAGGERFNPNRSTTGQSTKEIYPKVGK